MAAVAPAAPVTIVAIVVVSAIRILAIAIAVLAVAITGSLIQGIPFVGQERLIETAGAQAIRKVVTSSSTQTLTALAHCVPWWFPQFSGYTVSAVDAMSDTAATCWMFAITLQLDGTACITTGPQFRLPRCFLCEIGSHTRV